MPPRAPARLAWRPVARPDGQRRAPPLDQLAQHGKLRCGLCAVRCVERTAQPRQGIQADTRLEGRAHEAQPLQGRIVEHAVAAVVQATGRNKPRTR